MIWVQEIDTEIQKQRQCQIIHPRGDHLQLHILLIFIIFKNNVNCNSIYYRHDSKLSKKKKLIHAIPQLFIRSLEI